MFAISFSVLFYIFRKTSFLDRNTLWGPDEYKLKKTSKEFMILKDPQYSSLLSKYTYAFLGDS